MSDFSNSVEVVEGISEKEWISISNKVSGITKESISVSDDVFIEQGYTCLTPNTSHEGNKLWVKPENWTKLLQSVKSIKNIQNKNNEIKSWKDALMNTQNLISIKEKDKNFEFEFKRNWVLKMSGISFVIKSSFVISEEEKNITKWIKKYSKTHENKSLEEFINFLSPDEKWDEILSLWFEKIEKRWNAIIFHVPEGQRDQWYSWVKKVWGSIVWNKEPTEIIKKMELSLDNIQQTYEKNKENLKKRIEILNTENLLNFDHFEDHFFSARARKREIVFFMGPPNTGKTYNSFNKLSEAKNGAYLSPLRLLALEGHETLLDRGVLNDLVTGEERKYSKGSTHVASTIEMANFSRPVDVTIIDEIQLLRDKDRGWAFTHAFIGAPTRELVLTGSKEAIPYLNNINAYLGENMVINELKSDRKLVIEKSLGQNFKILREGDALIAFSRKEVLSWKEGLERKGYTVSAIYGHLSPEVRREEARKFREGETQLLVSTDAIGLGLNLPIKRIIFTSIEKFDGIIDRVLKPSEAWQIANRAGRKGWVESGSVTTWFSEDEDTLRMLLNTEDETPKDFKWWVQPLPEQVELWNKKMGGSLSQILEVFSNKLLQGHKVFKPCSMETAISRAEKMKYLKLPIADMYSYATAPVDKEDLESEMKLLEWAYIHSNGKKIKWSDVKYLWVEKGSYHSKGEALLDIEKKVRLLTVYRWLTLRFPDIYYGNKEAMIEHAYLNTRIEKYLIEIVKRKEAIGKGKGMYIDKRSTFA